MKKLYCSLLVFFLARLSSFADAISITGFQPNDADLTLISGAAGAQTTPFGRGLLDDADAAAVRISLGGVVTSVEIDTADDLSAMIGGQTTGTGNFVRSTGAIINDSRRTIHVMGNISGSSSLNFTTSGSWKTATLIGNVTFSNITLSAGSVGIMTVTQDATGGRTITWPGSVVTPLPTISTAANSSTVITLSTHDGTNIFAVGSSPAAAGALLVANNLSDLANPATARINLGGVVTSGEIDTADDLASMIGGQVTGTGNFVRSSGGTINDSRRTIHVLGNLSGSSPVNFTTSGSWKTATLIGNVTFSNITLSAGSIGVMTVTQDATGGRTITWPGSVVTPLPTINTSPNTSTVISFSTHDGTNIFAVGASPAAGGGAPTTASYLVGAADGALPSAIVVGATPVGELGGTWAAPTIDDGLTVDLWTLTTPTLTTPRFADLGYIADAAGLKLLTFDSNASAVNSVILANGATTINPRWTAEGETNVGIDWLAKGDGTFRFLGNSVQAGTTKYMENSVNGTDFISVKAPENLAGPFGLTWPAVNGTLLTSGEVNTAAEVNALVADDDFVTLAGAQTIAGDKTFSGKRILGGVELISGTSMAALSVDVTKPLNTKSVSANSTLTFSATPTPGTFFSLRLIETGGTARTITIPTSVSLSLGTITTFNLAANARLWLTWYYDGTDYYLFGDPVRVIDIPSATIATADSIEFYDVTDGLSKRDTVASLATVLGSGSALPMGYLSGLTLSNNVADATNDIDVAVGVARDAANTQDISLAAIITKRLDAAWVVGDAQGGLDTGSIANTTYHVWLIKRTDGTAVDVLFSASATAPTMPSGYTFKRRIGSIMRAAGVIRPFVQFGNAFGLTTPVLDVNTAALGTTSTNFTLSVPTGIKVRAFMNAICSNASAGAAVYVRDPAMADLAPASNAAPLMQLRTEVATQYATGELQVYTNTSAQIAARANLASTTFLVATRGWFDERDINATTGGIAYTKTGVFRTLPVNAGAMIKRTTNGAAAGTVELATNDIMLDSYDFDSAVEEGVGFWVTMPREWNGGALKVVFGWTAASGSGNVKWDVAARAFAHDDALDQALGTEQSAGVQTLTAVNDLQITSVTPSLTPAGAPAGGQRLYFQVTRDVATDTLGADAKLTDVEIQYQESSVEPASL